MDERMITARVLEFLLEQRFHSKAEMARALGMQQRTLEKVFARLDAAKGATIALSKALDYCLRNGVLLDPIFKDVISGNEESEETQLNVSSAYKRLIISKPDNLNENGEILFSSMHVFVCSASALMCPKCKTWCNPWDGRHDAAKLSCCIGHMAREIIKDVAEFYTAEGDDG